MDRYEFGKSSIETWIHCALMEQFELLLLCAFVHVERQIKSPQSTWALLLTMSSSSASGPCPPTTTVWRSSLVGWSTMTKLQSTQTAFLNMSVSSQDCTIGPDCHHISIQWWAIWDQVEQEFGIMDVLLTLLLELPDAIINNMDQTLSPGLCRLRCIV